LINFFRSFLPKFSGKQWCKQQETVQRIAKNKQEQGNNMQIGPSPTLQLDLDYPKASEALD
jgi:hypothetical protein